MSEFKPRQWAEGEEAEWIAEKLGMLGDYGQDAARVLRSQVSELAALRSQVTELQRHSNIELQKQIAALELTVQGLTKERNGLQRQLSAYEEAAKEPVVWYRKEALGSDQFTWGVFYETKCYEDLKPLFAHPINLTALLAQVAELQRQLSAYEEAAKQGPVAYIYPAAYGSRVSLAKNNKPGDWDDDDCPWYEEPLYAAPVNTAAIIEQAKAEEADRIGRLIHWPECWDTAAYPTLEDAITEINHCTVCENPEAHGYPKDWKQRSTAIRARKP